MITKLPPPTTKFLYRFLVKYSIMNAQLQRMCKTAEIGHIAICEGFFLSFYVWVLFQAIVWMLSLANCHFSSTFIKQLEWQYLDAIHREAYNMKQLLFSWNHYRVSVWDTSGRWFEDHQWIMTKWVFEEVIWEVPLAFFLFFFFAQELPVQKLRKNVSWEYCHIDFGTEYNNHVLVKQNSLQWVWRGYSPQGVWFIRCEWFGTEKVGISKDSWTCEVNACFPEDKTH